MVPKSSPVRLGRPLGAHFGNLGGLLGDSWGALGRSWEILGELLAGPGSDFGERCGALRSFWGPRDDFGRFGNEFNRFGDDFEWIFDLILVRFCVCCERLARDLRTSCKRCASDLQATWERIANDLQSRRAHQSDRCNDALLVDLRVNH